MTGQFQYRPDRQTGPLLATTLVICLGALGSAVVITAGGQSPMVGLLIFLGIVVVIPTLLYLLKATPQSALTLLSGLVKPRANKTKVEYKPRARRSGQHYGTNRPPSADDVKELRGGLNNWVPSQSAAPPRRPQP